MELGEHLKKLRHSLRVTGAVLWATLIALWRIVRPFVVAALNIVLALIVVFEEWGWEPLAALLARLAKFRPWAMLELWVAGLPPYGALCVFALPGVLLFPFKLVAFWLLAHGKVVLAGATFALAKVVSTAFLARIFMLTKPALMQIGWFARAYHWFIPWKEAAHDWLRESWAWRVGRVVKYRAKRMAKSAWVQLRPRAEALANRVRPYMRDGRQWASDQWARARQAAEGLWRNLFGGSHL